MCAASAGGESGWPISIGVLLAVVAALADAEVKRIEIDCSELDWLDPDGTHVLFEAAELCHTYRVSIDLRMGRHGRILSADTFHEAVATLPGKWFRAASKASRIIAIARCQRVV